MIGNALNSMMLWRFAHAIWVRDDIRKPSPSKTPSQRELRLSAFLNLTDGQRLG